MSASLSAAAEHLAALARHQARRAADTQADGMVYVLEPADYTELVQRADAVTRELQDPNVPPVWGSALRLGPWWDPRYTVSVTISSTGRELPLGRRYLSHRRAEDKADGMAAELTGFLVRLGVIETGHACQAIRVDLQGRP